MLPVYGQLMYQNGLVDEEEYANLTSLGYYGAALIGEGKYARFLELMGFCLPARTSHSTMKTLDSLNL